MLFLPLNYSSAINFLPFHSFLPPYDKEADCVRGIKRLRETERKKHLATVIFPLLFFLIFSGTIEAIISLREFLAAGRHVVLNLKNIYKHPETGYMCCLPA